MREQGAGTVVKRAAVQGQGCAIGDNHPLLVVKASGADALGFCRLDAAFGVVHRLLALDFTLARRGRDQPLLVVHGPGFQPGIARYRHDLPCGVVDSPGLQPGIACHRHNLPGGVIEGVSLELHAVRRANLPLLVIDVARQIDSQRVAATLDDVAFLVTEVVGAEVNRLRAQRAPGVVE